MDWIDPRPNLPIPGVMVEVKCDDGSVRKALIQNTWDGFIWKYGYGCSDQWSMAHPKIIGWRNVTNPASTAN